MITSRSNELIKLVLKLKEKKYSKDNALCVVESIKLVTELYMKGYVETILVTENKLNIVSKFENARIEVISSDLANYITDAVSTDGVVAICRIPESKNVKYHRCLVLDRIQDPSNMGAIIRSAKAFGFETIFTIDSVYPYTFKTIRASMGFVFGVNIIDVDLKDLMRIKSENNITFLTADMNGISVEKISKINNNLAIIIGNEGSGVSDILEQMSDKAIAIPMSNEVESLNASVSAGIIMYLLK